MILRSDLTTDVRVELLAEMDVQSDSPELYGEEFVMRRIVGTVPEEVSHLGSVLAGLGAWSTS